MNEITGETLYILRKQAGLTQEEVASRLNPPRSGSILCKWERDRRPVPPEYLQQLIDILDR